MSIIAVVLEFLVCKELLSSGYFDCECSLSTYAGHSNPLNCMLLLRPRMRSWPLPAGDSWCFNRGGATRAP